MKHIPFEPPGFGKAAFNCPHCNAYAHNRWEDIHLYSGGRYPEVKRLKVSICSNCGDIAVWLDQKMINPDASQAPIASPDLPESIVGDYDEARSIINRSPRGAAALLRLCLQKLCVELGEKGKNINDDIKALVARGLNPHIQKSLDIVRVIGNESVHPGVIDLKDKPDTAVKLCQLINIIVDALITQPKEIEGLYSSLPEDKKAQIEKRDGK